MNNQLRKVYPFIVIFLKKSLAENNFQFKLVKMNFHFEIYIINNAIKIKQKESMLEINQHTSTHFLR